jgi:ketosteroid isomerase-like protein
MENAMPSTEYEVGALFDDQFQAMRTKDIDRLMPLYSPDIIYFDVVPPLQFVGSTALRGRFLRWFDGWQSTIDMEIRDVNIVVSGDIAVAHWFSKASGTLKGGREAGFWLRVTSCCQRTGTRWLIAHEHVSLPVDLGSGVAATQLTPP